MKDINTKAPERDLLDDDGENLAVRTFLQLYGAAPSSITLGEMCRHLSRYGFDGCWPDWVVGMHGAAHMTKCGAQSWLRYLFSLEAVTSPPAVTDISGQEGELGCIDANRLEQMAKERPNECFLKGSDVLKLTGAIRQLEAEISALSAERVICEDCSDALWRAYSALISCDIKKNNDFREDQYYFNLDKVKDAIATIRHLIDTTSDAPQQQRRKEQNERRYVIGSFVGAAGMVRTWIDGIREEMEQTNG